MGGEKFAPLLYHTSEGGSPPRGRGKAVLEVAAVQAVGITPAWAGKRLLSMLDCAASGDHPRVGGEKPQG